MDNIERLVNEVPQVPAMERLRFAAQVELTEEWLMATRVEDIPGLAGHRLFRAVAEGMRRMVHEKKVVKGVKRHETHTVFYEAPQRWLDYVLEGFRRVRVGKYQPLQFLGRWIQSRRVSLQVSLPTLLADVHEHYHICPAPPEAFDRSKWQEYCMMDQPPAPLAQEYKLLRELVTAVERDSQDHFMAPSATFKALFAWRALDRERKRFW
jgi:hypothetical protein